MYFKLWSAAHLHQNQLGCIWEKCRFEVSTLTKSLGTRAQEVASINPTAETKAP